MMTCEFCPAKFKDGRGLANHMRTKHLGIYLKAGYRPKYTNKNATFHHNDRLKGKSK